MKAQRDALTCTYPLAKTILLILGILALLIVLAVIFWRTQRRRLYTSLFILAGLCLLTAWLGSYRYSPLELFGEQNPLLRGFLVTRHGRVNEMVASGGIITLSAGSPMGIVLLSDAPITSCHWKSLNGGVWDDPDICDTTYAAPQAEYDILTVRIEPGCGLPSARGQIKISILP